MKKIFTLLLAMVATVGLTACSNDNNSDKELYEFSHKLDYNDIAEWDEMVGADDNAYAILAENITKSDDNKTVTFTNEPGQWQGRRSDEITLTFAKNPQIQFTVTDNGNDQVCKWGAKFFPKEPAIDDHAWGWYLVPDTVQHWGTTIGSDFTTRLGGGIEDVYGETITGYIDIYVVGSIPGADSGPAEGCSITLESVNILQNAN